MQHSTGKIGKILAFRLEPGEYVLEGIKKACEDANIKNGVIISGIGSLDGARYFNPIPMNDKKAGYGYGEELILRGPIELVNVNGMICEGEEGETLLHIHCGFSDQYGNAYGGHLIDGNKVLLTVDIVVGEIEGMIMGRRYDENLEVFVFNPKSR